MNIRELMDRDPAWLWPAITVVALAASSILAITIANLLF